MPVLGNNNNNNRPKCYYGTEYVTETEYDTVYAQQCTTQYEEKCETQYETQCTTQYETVRHGELHANYFGLMSAIVVLGSTTITLVNVATSDNGPMQHRIKASVTHLL